MRSTVIILLSLTVAVIMSNPLSPPQAPPSDYSEGGCDYDCGGWPYRQCKVSKTFKDDGVFRSAECISPYYREASYRMLANYPECATIPSGCERCDDFCSRKDGHDKFDYTETGPKNPTSISHISSPPPQSPSSPDPEDCSEIKDRLVCCVNYGECSRYTGPDPTPWKRAKFTTCEYSDGYLRCDFSNDCSKMPNGRMVCCEDGGDCSAYVGPNPSDPLCSFRSDGGQVCA